MKIFAIDFTHEQMTAAFVTPDGVAEDTAGFDLSDFIAGEADALDKLVSLLALKARASGGDVAAVALSMPCALDRDRERVVNFHSAPWLNEQPLPAILSGMLGVPAVMARRSAVSLFYDKTMLGLPDDCLAVGCYVDTHYSSAIWDCGRFILGKNGGAGNIAHMPVAGREDHCFCGKSGCVDLYGAGQRMAQIHSMIFPDVPLEELFEREGGHPIFRDYIATMAYPIAIEVNILDPDFLVLGGAIPSMRGFPRALLEEEILRQCYRASETHAATFLGSVASATPGVICAAQYVAAKLGLF